ncbi:OmpA family protein [Nocardiopsis sediminis]|uniref:OmpA family protein n=1 Tax=Nocardiopsis sediminis TaxID=1778267 RepID=A0ABV8FM45_9ACTN
MNGSGRRALALAGLLALSPALLGAGEGQQDQQPQGEVSTTERAESIVDLDVDGATTTLDLEGSMEPLEQDKTEGTTTTVTVATDVLFEFDSADLSGDAQGNLDDIAGRLEGVSGTVEVIGHSDGLGEDDYNQELSEQRAEAVRGALEEILGGDAPEFEASGRGSDEPVAEETDSEGNDLPSGRAENRRVEIVYEEG